MLPQFILTTALGGRQAEIVDCFADEQTEDVSLTLSKSFSSAKINGEPDKIPVASIFVSPQIAYKNRPSC